MIYFVPNLTKTTEKSRMPGFGIKQKPSCSGRRNSAEIGHVTGFKSQGWWDITLNDQSLISQAIDGYRKQVAKDIGPNGACSDFYVRDSLHYQLYSVEPLLTLARACERYGEPLFDYHAPNHGSLHDAVDFVVPFAEGRKTHIEFAYSKSHFDTRRGAGWRDRVRSSRMGAQSFDVDVYERGLVSSRIWDACFTIGRGNRPEILGLANGH